MAFSESNPIDPIDPGHPIPSGILLAYFLHVLTPLCPALQTETSEQTPYIHLAIPALLQKTNLLCCKKQHFSVLNQQVIFSFAWMSHSEVYLGCGPLPHNSHHQDDITLLDRNIPLNPQPPRYTGQFFNNFLTWIAILGRITLLVQLPALGFSQPVNGRYKLPFKNISFKNSSKVLASLALLLVRVWDPRGPHDRLLKPNL